MDDYFSPFLSSFLPTSLSSENPYLYIFVVFNHGLDRMNCNNIHYVSFTDDLILKGVSRRHVTVSFRYSYLTFSFIVPVHSSVFLSFIRGTSDYILLYYCVMPFYHVYTDVLLPRTVSLVLVLSWTSSTTYIG